MDGRVKQAQDFFTQETVVGVHFFLSLAPVRFRYKKHLVIVKKTSYFGLNYLFWWPQTRL